MSGETKIEWHDATWNIITWRNGAVHFNHAYPVDTHTSTSSRS